MLRANPTVRRSLFVLVATAVLPTLIAAVAALLYAYKEEQASFQRGLTETTRALAQVVEREIARREAIALTLSGLPALSHGDLRAFHEYASRIAPTRDKVVVLQNLEGQQLVNTRLPFGAALPKSSLNTQREDAGPFSTVVSNLYFAPVGKQHSFAVQVPVVQEGKAIYYLSVAGFASALQSIVEDSRLPKGWIASILDAKGLVVARNEAPERFVGNPTSDRLSAQLSQRGEGVFESTTIDGVPILAAFSKLPGYGWAMVIGVPLSTAGAPIKVIMAFGALAALLLMLTVLAALGTGRRLLKPVERLKEASQAVGSGKIIDAAPTGLVETDQILASLQEADRRINLANESLEARRQEAEAAAQALRKSNERVQLSTNASGLGLFTWDPVSDSVTWHNDRPYGIFGISPADGPVDAKRFVAEFLLPADAPAFALCLERSLKGDMPFFFEGRIQRQIDREVRWVEFTGQVERAEDGSAVRVVGTAADITLRKKTADALRESEARLLQLANTIPNLAWMADADGWITWYNDRWYEYTGTTPAEMEGWGWQKVHDPASLPAVMQRWGDSIRTGQPFEMTFPLLGKDGSYRPFFTRVAPLRDATGSIVQWFGTNTDVLPLKQAEDELRRADRRKDEFLAMLAHELRNPLAPIRTAAELLKRLDSAEPRVARASQIIARQVGHLSGLLDDLLDVSRVTRGLMILEKERVDLLTVIASAIEQVKPLIEARKHQLSLDLGTGPLHVLASPLRLTQIFANLLDNAAKYSAPGGRIGIDVRALEGRARVAVTDEGIGISTTLLKHVFEPFTQAERGSDRSEGGLGLGLAVVKGLVELQGGSVNAQSAGLGMGSRFEIELPLLALEQAEVSPVQEKAAVQRHGEGLAVLIVDDNVDAAETLLALLDGSGFRARCAYTAGAALALMERERFDIAVLDIGLPDMTGYELAGSIREAGLGTPVLIALSGYGQSEDRQASTHAGFALHLVKPVEPEVLIAALSAAGPPAKAEGRPS